MSYAVCGVVGFDWGREVRKKLKVWVVSEKHLFQRIDN
jgi:hypothetical protein